MAIYHLHAQVISRAAGRTSTAAAAYRAAEKIHDQQLGESFDYTKKTGVVHTEVLAPEHAPAWTKDRAQLWNAVEVAEKRKDAQLAREVRVALPKELDTKAQVNLVRSFVNEQFVSHGMVADFSIHHDKPDNPHAHIMLSMRSIDENGFGKKERSWNAKDRLVQWRESWALSANRALERAGQDVCIDHRSYREQGIALEPTNKIGSDKAQAEQDGRDIIRERLAKHDAIVRRNGEAIRDNPLIALEAITHQRAVFSRRDVGRWLNTRTIDAEQFQGALSSVMASSELVLLGERRGQQVFTTKQMQQVEERMLGQAEAMAGRELHGVTVHQVRQAEHGKSLSDEQRQAMWHVLKPGGLAVVEGHAGVGKSYMLGAAREAWEAQGYRVCGAALAGKAAEGLEVSAGISSRSLHAWEYAWKQGKDRLGSRDVLVIDEAGMVGSRQMGRVLQEAHHAGAKVVLVGDSKQLQAIEAGAPLRAIGERLGAVKLQDIRRQNEEWQRQAAKNLAAGRIVEALEAFKSHGRVHGHAEQKQAMVGVVQAWDAGRQAQPKATQMMLAFKRDEVRSLNKAARHLRRQAGELGRDHRVETERGGRDFARNDRIYFLKNSRELGVKNGTLGTVEKIRGDVMQVRLDDGKRFAFDVRQYSHLDHGYAATVHKAQGVTVDRAYVLASTHYDQHVAYVALSRQRQHVELHWSQEKFGTEDKLKQVLGRERPKELVVDYAKAEKQNEKFAKAVPAPEARKSPYEVMTAKEIQGRYWQLERQANREARTAPQVLESFSEVSRAKAELKFRHDQSVAHRQGLEAWEKAHPMKAKLGLGGHGGMIKEMGEVQGLRDKAEKHFMGLWNNKQLQEKAKGIAKAEKHEVRSAREELQVIAPFYGKVMEEIKQERAKELENSRGRWIER